MSAGRRMGCSVVRAALALMVAASLSACAGLSTRTVIDPGYYWQSVRGHLQLMEAARPVQAWLDDPATPAPLRARLELAQQMRAYASATLGLPAGASYTRYADLGRRYALWNVVAAPADSLELHTWCFPVAGCVSYRGYYDEAQARAMAAALAAQGLEVTVHGVTAYSTLGWLDWLGGDPLLNTFLLYPEGELARIVFHELAHQVVYVPDDTPFNESFATAVERLGGERWLAQSTPAAQREYQAYEARRRAFRELTRDTRRALADVYADGPVDTTAESAAQIAQRKAQVMAQFRDRYQAMRQQWSELPRVLAFYDDWVASANNASFGALATYDELVPGFEALFVQVDRDWPRFYAAVQALAKQSKTDRREALLRAASKMPLPGAKETKDG